METNSNCIKTPFKKSNQRVPNVIAHRIFKLPKVSPIYTAMILTIREASHKVWVETFYQMRARKI